MRDLSVIIPSRNEVFLKRTIDNILENIEGDTEIIAILDGQWSEPRLPDHERVTLVYHSESIGQRAATNEGVKLSTAKYIMKSDAHMAFDKGFDVKLIAPYEDGILGKDVTTIARMYNLHGFDWKCNKCGERKYQGPTPGTKNKTGELEPGCSKCDNKDDFEKVVVWEPRKRRMTEAWRIDRDLKFAYWNSYKERPESQGDIVDVMCPLGACWFMHRDRYWEIGGLDEQHGSWGQMGVEISCKSWLSGGRQVVNKTTWYSHMFRTQGGDFGFPWKFSGNQVHKARKHSANLWLNNTWEGAVLPFNWLINKFRPPEWPTKGIVYYTDNKVNIRIANQVRGQIDKAHLPVVNVSLKPLNWGQNIHLELERGKLTMFKQILAGLEASNSDVIFFCEHDVLYHPSHFNFTPPEKEKIYYNTNTWKLNWETKHAIHYDCKQTSGLCAYRDVLIEHYTERVRRVEADGHSNRIGYEPASHNRAERIDDLKSDVWKSPVPNIDIRHDNNLTPSRWHKDQFRSQKNCQNWQEAEQVPGWDMEE